MPVGESSFARATEVGSGVLNVNRAVSAATVAATRTPSIKNLSSTADTIIIAALPLGRKPAPSLSTTTVPLDAGASQVFGVEFNPADMAAGDYQGVFRIPAPY